MRRKFTDRQSSLLGNLLPEAQNDPNVLTFAGRTAAEAVEQVHQRLGPEAVIYSIRRLPARGFSRLWQRYSCIELQAGLPDAGCSGVARRLDLGARPAGTGAAVAPTQGASLEVEACQRLGLLPLFAQRVQEHLEAGSSPDRPASPGDVWERARAVLFAAWRPAPALAPESEGAHLFIGPPGSGKTTALCQWLAQTVLVEGREAAVWRLDTSRPNTAEWLRVYCEILGVREERAWDSQDLPSPGKRCFVDLPGVCRTDHAALRSLAEQLRAWKSPCVHLVLNAAYDSALLLAQARAFAALPVSDVILTHLDEENSWSKLWNLVLGTNYSIRFVTAGQNIPGPFLPATPELLWEGRNSLAEARFRPRTAAAAVTGSPPA